MIIKFKYIRFSYFPEMWYQIFLWALFSSIFVHTIAGAICFATLRQHKYGKYVRFNVSGLFINCMICMPLNDTLELSYISLRRFFPLLIIIMGVLLPLTSGVVSSAAVAFVYRASGYQMPPLYAMFWGIGQTVLPVCVGFTRILATL